MNFVCCPSSRTHCAPVTCGCKARVSSKTLMNTCCRREGSYHSKRAGQLPLAVVTDCDQYLHDRVQTLKQQLEAVSRMAAVNELPDATITNAGLKFTALTNDAPESAETLMQQAYALLPHVKITE